MLPLWPLVLCRGLSCPGEGVGAERGGFVTDAMNGELVRVSSRLPPASCLLPPASCLLLTVYRLPPTVYRLPPTAYRLPHVTS